MTASQDEFEAAPALDASVLAPQREALGEDDLDTLMTTASLAADLRGLSRYFDAVQTDMQAHRRLRPVFGPDHEQTLPAANNLAVSHRLNGESAAALGLDTDTLERRAMVLGSKHPYTLGSRRAPACGYRELGNHRSALTLLERAYGDDLEVLGADFVETLRTRTVLAVSARCLGEHERARVLSEETASRFEMNYSPDHPDALACQICLAPGLAASGGGERALEDLHLQPLARSRGGGPDRTGTGTTGRDDAEARGDVRREMFGESHPATAAARQGDRLDHELVPQPI